MAITISNAFITGYERDVHEAYQRRGAKLRKTVRHAEGVVGSTHVFQKAGKGVATTKSRHGQITPMNVSHTNATATLADSYAGDWVDKLDLDKLNIDERRVITNAGAFALGRKVDADIITVMDSTTTTNTTTTTMTLTKVLAAHATLGGNDVFEMGRMYAIVPYTEWNDLLQIQQFASADFVTDLPFLEGHEAKRWMGTIWMPHTGLDTLVSGSVAKSFWYHEDAIGHAQGSEITADFDWYGDRAAWFVNNMMSQGAVLIDTNGVIEIQTTRP